MFEGRNPESSEGFFIMAKYKSEWDDNGWWFVWKDVGDKWKVFLPIEGDEDDERANTIVKALNGSDVENDYINMLLSKDEEICKLKDKIANLETEVGNVNSILNFFEDGTNGIKLSQALDTIKSLKYRIKELTPNI